MGAIIKRSYAEDFYSMWELAQTGNTWEAFVAANSVSPAQEIVQYVPGAGSVRAAFKLGYVRR